MTLELDVLIFGGGAAGLWLLDEPIRRRARVLLTEDRALGDGQIAEDNCGVQMEPGELIDFAKSDLESVLPGTNFSTARWST